jgi:hypothetical protein
LQAGVKFAKESVTEVTAYNKTIREMGQVTGLGAEEISRIIQVGDDWGVSIDSIRTSLAFMNKKGITPSIDNLAKIADEYVAATDKSKWAEEAVKTLGRGYQTLIPLLALGGDGFRDAAAGIDASLIATDKGIKASREYEVAMDDLTDTVTGLKYELGNGLIPTLVEFLETTNKVTSRITSEESAWKKIKKAREDALISQYDMIEAYLKISTGIWDAADAEAWLLTKTEKLDKGERDLNETTNTLAVTFDTTLASAISDAREDMGGMTSVEIADQIRSLGELKTAADNYATALGTLTSQGIQALTDSMAEQIKKQALLDLWQGKITLGTYQQIVADTSLLGNVEKLNAGIEDGTVTELEWMAAMADNIVTNEELEAAMAPTTAEALALATNVGLATGALHDMDGTTANTYIYHHDITEYTEVRPPGYKGKWAAGTDFIIPPGYNDDNYPLGFGQSGERVVVIPKGQVTNNNSFNMNVHTNAQTSSVMGDFNKMKAWAG